MKILATLNNRGVRHGGARKHTRGGAGRDGRTQSEGRAT
jgi:hypothetical protein